MLKLYDFWGKADRNGPSWHPAVCHMIDTGIVAKEILAVQPINFQLQLTSPFQNAGQNALDVLAFVSAIHDIGKISPGFQQKSKDLCECLKHRGFTFPQTSEPKHGRVALVVLKKSLQEMFGCSIEEKNALARVLAAHHGVFDESLSLDVGDHAWQEARRDILTLLARTFGITSLASVRLDNVPVLFLLAGLISVADWIASNEAIFPYLNAPPKNIEQYIADRRIIAQKFLNRLSLGTTVETEKGFHELFDFENPNACQQATLNVSKKLSHPMLVIVETPMGSGKTEAAQAAYASLAKRVGLRGMYCALPTQATGNAMFSRMRTFLARLHGEQTAELHLLHANADINPEYEQLKLKSIGEKDDSITASGWFAAKKRGLLATYGTGTIDQALLAVLRVRHFFVRLFGLSGKMIILDEVHAYDAYMSEEIYSLIGWASRCGSSIILLSATLPEKKRTKLVQAFYPSVELPTGLRYPSVFGVDLQGTVVWEPVALKDDHLAIDPIIVTPDEKLTVMAEKVVNLVTKDGCAACIVNTVAEAQDLFDLLKTRFPEEELMLFHSRFTLERRLAIEKELLEKYGKGNNRPRRGIVVASPVLQESLDVCFDVMLSDIAPFDLLLQRAGRLHRHTNIRPPHLQDRQMFVFLPDLLHNKPDFGWSGLIYFRYLLDRTGRLFFKNDQYPQILVKLPGGVSPLIEQVYGEDDIALDKIRELWFEEREGAESADGYFARVATIESVHDQGDEPGYLSRLKNSADEEMTPSTRVGRQRVLLVILNEGDETAILTREKEKELFRKTLATDNPRLVHYFSKLPQLAEWRESPLLRYCQPVFLTNGIVQAGESTLAYDEIRGLSILQKTGGIK